MAGKPLSEETIAGDITEERLHGIAVFRDNILDFKDLAANPAA